MFSGSASWHGPLLSAWFRPTQQELSILLRTSGWGSQISLFRSIFTLAQTLLRFLQAAKLANVLPQASWPNSWLNAQSPHKKAKPQKIKDRSWREINRNHVKGLPSKEIKKFLWTKRHFPKETKRNCCLSEAILVTCPVEELQSSLG